jgi:hypothetical protein
MDQHKVGAGEEANPVSEGLHRGRRRLIALITGVAVLSGAAGAFFAVVVTNGGSSPSRLAPTVSTTSVVSDGAVGQPVTVDDWRVVVNDYRVTDDAEGRKPPLASHWLLADVAITNMDAKPRVWFAPDQITLTYLTPTLERPGPQGWGCDSGYCERSPEFGGGGKTGAANTIRSRQTVHWPFVFLIPDGANGFRLEFRSALEQEKTTNQAAEVNLSCC